MATYYKVETADWASDEKFVTMADAKNFVMITFNVFERNRKFSPEAKARITHLKDRKDGTIDCLSVTPFATEFHYTKFGKTCKC